MKTLTKKEVRNVVVVAVSPLGMAVPTKSDPTDRRDGTRRGRNPVWELPHMTSTWERGGPGKADKTKTFA